MDQPAQLIQNARGLKTCRMQRMYDPEMTDFPD